MKIYSIESELDYEYDWSVAKRVARIGYTMVPTHMEPHVDATQLLFLSVIYDLESMTQLIHQVPCIQHFFDHNVTAADNEMIWMIYDMTHFLQSSQSDTIQSSKRPKDEARRRKMMSASEMIHEMKSWKHFDFVSLSLNSVNEETEVNDNGRSNGEEKGDGQSTMSKYERVVLQHVDKRFKRVSQRSYDIINRDNIFDLSYSMRLLGMKSHFHGDGEIEDENIVNKCNYQLMIDSVADPMAKSRIQLNLSNKKKLAVVVPFSASSVSKTLMQLQLWQIHKPCLQSVKGHSAEVDLIFYFDAGENSEMERTVLQQLTVDGSANGKLRPEFHCVSPIIRFWYSNLTPQESVLSASTNIMFHRLIHDPRFYTQYQFFYYADVRTSPIRDGWLNQLMKVTSSIDNNWWSIAAQDEPVKDYGDPSQMITKSCPQYYHLGSKGGALYNTCGSFRDFLTRANKQYPIIPPNGNTNPCPPTNTNLDSKFIASDLIVDLPTTSWTLDSIQRDYSSAYFLRGYG